MNSDLQKLVKRLLAPILVPLSAVLSAILAVRLLFSGDLPRWVGIFVILGIVALAVAGLFVYRLWFQKSDFTDDGTPLDPADEKAGVRSLERVWNDAIQFLRRSELKKRGNPLYVLPWYMLIGEEDSGKSALIQNAGLTSFGERSNDASATEPSTCDWSFFEQAVILDTAGRYASAAPSERDRAEWDRVVELLARHRRKEPLNGLIVTVPAEKLIESGAETLEGAAQTIRKRIDELIRALGAKFPVYVLVTRCDAINGMDAFFEPLSESGLRQPMGFVNQATPSNPGSFVDTVLNALAERLKTLRLVMTHQPGGKRLGADWLSFPDGFSALHKGLSAYVRGIFTENVYQETPLLRGVYFTGNGLFLHTFFAELLPADRTLYAPTKRALEWRRGTLNMGLASWLIFSVAMVGLLTHSFARNLGLLRETDRQFSRLPPLQGSFGADVFALDQMNQGILKLQAKIDQGWLPRFGLHESDRVAQALSEHLSIQFRRQLLPPFEDQNGKVMNQFSAGSADVPFSRAVEHLIGRIKLIRERVRGHELRAKDPLPVPTIPWLRVGPKDASDDVKQKFAELYRNTIFWHPHQEELTLEMRQLQASLKRLLKLKSQSPQWVIAWAKAQGETIPPVTLRDYWGGGAASASEPSVPAIFSRKAKGLVDSFFGEIETALSDPEAYDDLKNQYERWYRGNAFEAWRRFVTAFPQGARRVNNRDAWRTTAARMPKDNGPYQALLNNVTLELEPFVSKDMPAWIKQIYRLDELRGPSAKARLGLRKIGINASNARGASVEALGEYHKALQKLATTAADPAKVVEATALTFAEGSGPGSSPFAVTFNALAKLREHSGIDDPAVWRLVSGPLDFLWEYARLETADHLQTEWEKGILASAAGIPPAQMAGILLGPQGTAIGFVKEQAVAFVDWKPGRGYHAKQAFGSTLPFTGGFFHFLNSSPKVTAVSHIDKLTVTVIALGAQANAGARRTPQSTRLSFTCNDDTEVLANRRQRLVDRGFSPAQKSFTWTPSCGETVVQIDIGSTRLVRRYPAGNGFLAFMADFKNGSHSFTPADFPEESPALAQMGISNLTVHYRLQGMPSEVPAAAGGGPTPPTRIVYGWAR